MADWYRRQTWTEVDEKEFFEKLGRARKDGRAQYLRIQAVTLIDTYDKNLLKVAETLLSKMLKEYPENNFERGSALYSLGDISKRFEDYDTAIDYYKQALDFEKIYPQVKTMAYLDYSELVVRKGYSELFGKLERILLKRYSGLLFPVEKYKVNSLLSIICKHKNDNEKAKYYATVAEENANAEISGLRYHKYLGVVTKRETWLDKLVENK